MATKLGDLTVAATTGVWELNDVTMTAGSKTVTLRRKSDGAVLATRSFTVEEAAAISLVGTPTSGVGAGSNITLPSGRAAGDILVIVESTSAAISGYTSKIGDGNLAVYWRRATGDASDNASVSSGISYAFAIYRGCVASGDPFDAVSSSIASGSTTSGALSIPQITTATNGAWVLAAASGWDGGWDDGEGGAGSNTGETWASATGAATTLAGSVANTGMGVALYHSEKATAGATGAGGVRFYMTSYSYGSVGSTTWGALLALKPA